MHNLTPVNWAFLACIAFMAFILIAYFWPEKEDENKMLTEEEYAAKVAEGRRSAERAHKTKMKGK